MDPRLFPAIIFPPHSISMPQIPFLCPLTLLLLLFIRPMELITLVELNNTYRCVTGKTADSTKIVTVDQDGSTTVQMTLTDTKYAALTPDLSELHFHIILDESSSCGGLMSQIPIECEIGMKDNNNGITETESPPPDDNSKKPVKCQWAERVAGLNERISIGDDGQSADDQYFTNGTIYILMKDDVEEEHCQFEAKFPADSKFHFLMKTTELNDNLEGTVSVEECMGRREEAESSNCLTSSWPFITLYCVTIILTITFLGITSFGFQRRKAMASQRRRINEKKMGTRRGRGGSGGGSGRITAAPASSVAGRARKQRRSYFVEVPPTDAQVTASDVVHPNPHHHPFEAVQQQPPEAAVEAATAAAPARQPAAADDRPSQQPNQQRHTARGR